MPPGGSPGGAHSLLCLSSETLNQPGRAQRRGRFAVEGGTTHAGSGTDLEQVPLS